MKATLSEHCREGWTAEDEAAGEQAVKEGRVGVLCLAGGQGSRFNAGKVKGCIPITLFKKKSLFQVIAEKVCAASALAGHPLQLAFMTSPTNHDAIIAYFKANDFFGLASSQLFFFEQEQLPLLDENKKEFFAAPGVLAQGPNGNGSVFKQMVTSGLWDRWRRAGIEAMQVLPVDNVLTMPFRYGQLGVHLKDKNDATLLVSKKRDPNEKLGSVVFSKKKVHIIEYSELSQEEKEAKDASGEFLYNYLNLGLLTFSLPFIKKVSKKKLPYHIARKASPRLINGEIVRTSEPFAHKYELFIFDAFAYSDKVEALLVDRAKWYAPLKNMIGEDSIETVQAAQLARDRQVYQKVTGVAPPQDARFELSQEFYYPSQEFLKKWRGKTLPQQGYIE